jgi:N-acylneuraminate cytidylyltransferase
MANILFLIPARGGSKGLPGKNIKLLNNKPLLHYSIEFARLFAPDENICLSTDSDEIIACAAQVNLAVPFKRPAALASDTAGSYEVLQHAVSFFENQGKKFDTVILLQPTSPIREKKHLLEALGLYTNALDMVVSVKLSKANPYYNLFEENKEGWLRLSKGEGQFTRRQDIPDVFEYNGSLYIINTRSLREKKSFTDFSSIKKYVMDEQYSIDLDTLQDWEYAEFLLKQAR